MAKIFFTEMPSSEEVKENAPLLHPDLDHRTLHTYLLLRKVSTDLEINLDKFFSRYALSSGRFTLLVLLNISPGGLMPSELAIKVGVTQATISGLINSLEKAELVKRMTHEKDGRSFVIKITDKGQSLYNELLPLYHERISQFWSPFSEQEKESVSQLMTKMLKSINKIGE